MIRVLLAENQGCSRAHLHRFLQAGERYCIVAEVGCFSDLLNCAGASQPDLILLDWDLPGLSNLRDLSGRQPTSTQLLKKLVVQLLHALINQPTVVVLCGNPDAAFAAQQTSADVVFCLAEQPEHVLSALDLIQTNGGSLPLSCA